MFTQVCSTWLYESANKYVLDNIDTATADVELAMNLTFADNSTQCLNLTIIDDTLVEGMETFTVNLTSVNTEVNVAFRIAEVIIEDNDGKQWVDYLYFMFHFFYC